MLAFATRRAMQTIVALAAMSLLVFAGVYAAGGPGDILVASQADPLELVGERLPATLELAFAAMLVALVVGVPLGLWAGLKPSGGAGRTIVAASLLGISCPTFWIGLMLIAVFSVLLGWLPSSGRGETIRLLGLVPVSFLSLDGWKHLILPALSLALFDAAVLIRRMRSSVRESLLRDHVRFARAKGLVPRRVIGAHVLPNVLPAVVTAVGLQFGALVAWAIVTETVFAWPGIGKLLIDSMRTLDLPVTIADLAVIVTLLVVLRVIVDLVRSALDPRVRWAATGPTTSVATVAASRAVDVPFRRVVARLGSNAAAVLGLALLGVIVCVALAAPLVSPQHATDLAHVDAVESLLPPGSKGADGVTFRLGTDGHGHDMLSAIGHGLRISLGVGIGATALALALGVATGLPAAYFAGRSGGLVVGIADIEVAFPAILVVLGLMAMLGPGISKVIAALVVVQWAQYARTVRDAVRVEKRKAYLDAARGLALGPSRIVLRHLLPNCVPLLLAAAAGQMAVAIVLEATLSFLGFGLPITEPSLGLLIADGQRELLAGRYWVTFFPGVALALTVLGLNLVADALRDAANPGGGR